MFQTFHFHTDYLTASLVILEQLASYSSEDGGVHKGAFRNEFRVACSLQCGETEKHVEQRAMLGFQIRKLHRHCGDTAG